MISALALALAVSTLAAGCTASPQSAMRVTAEATDAPGAVSHQSQSRKDCIGTARNDRSKIWFTVANGILSDVYAPTVDATNVETMQFLVTDGASFTDLQSRDMTYSVSADATGMVCTVTSTARSGAYRLVNRYFTDPQRNSVVVRTTFVPLSADAKKNPSTYKLFVRLDANAGGNGGGGSANGGADSAVIDTSTASPVPVSFDMNTQSQADRSAYAVPSFLAVAADSPFDRISSGFVGTPSDGLTQLDASHALTATGTTATDGNVEQTMGLQRDALNQSTLALGFGTSRASAVETAQATVATPLARMQGGYTAGWASYDRGLTAPALSAAGLTAAQLKTATRSYFRAANVVKASEDKTYPGAIVAGVNAPWGQSIPANDPNNLFVGGYKEVFARDLYEAWTALYTAGDMATARDTVRYLLLSSQQANGSQPRNSLLDGTKAADAFNDQLDETAYPLLMALQSGLADDNDLWPHVKLAANFLISHGPSFGVERWEEQPGYSPSTIAAQIAGLVAAAAIADQHGDPTSAAVWRATADQYQRSITTWGVTTTGPLSMSPYFIRLSKTGDPNAAISYNVGNGGPTLDQRAIVDAGFLEYVRLGILPATDPTILDSLVVTDATLQRSTESGAGWLRYNGDGYGDCFVGVATNCAVTGAPWTNNFSGLGHPWPVLGVERAQQYLAQGQAGEAAAQLVAINAMNSGPGLVPEQVWDQTPVPASPFGSDPATASIGFVNGQSVGSASPLTWGSAAQVRLTAALGAGRSLEQPAEVRDRYVSTTQATTPLTVTAPTEGSQTPATTTVSGTAEPGAGISLARVATDEDSQTATAHTTADATGAFTVDVPSAFGTNVIVITSIAAGGGTAQLVRSVVSDAVDGELIFSRGDPVGDDNGPRNYAYPTSGDFTPDAFDLTGFEMYDTGSSVTFRVKTRDLTPAFGSPNGAQLVDVYVHSPEGTASSTSSAFPSMNYQLAEPWSRLIEVQGFGNNRFVDSIGISVGSLSVRANPTTDFISFRVDKAALGGTPVSGWGFTVALTGQDGTQGPDQTRAFTPTPGAFTFGVCATARANALCSADPTSVPRVMDILTPDGVTQSTELDYTAQDPVVLPAVVIP
ncbi:glucan 1,4-alpha-glucosidase [Cryobacterium sp. MLB-32]|nr:glucan 1,4-alpha-glucosidase [Cryobacterium sp. MLB-32]